MLLLIILEPSNALKKKKRKRRTFGIDNGYKWFFTGWCYHFHLSVGFFQGVFYFDRFH